MFRKKKRNFIATVKITTEAESNYHSITFETRRAYPSHRGLCSQLFAKWNEANPDNICKHVAVLNITEVSDRDLKQWNAE
jgi:hypothetical protein